MAISKAKWLQIRLEYQTGQGSLRELGEKYGIPISTIEQRSMREKWTQHSKEVQGRIEAKIEKKLTDEAVDWVTNMAKRQWRSLQDVDSIRKNHIKPIFNEKTGEMEEVIILDPIAYDAWKRSEQRTDDMARRIFGLPDSPQQLKAEVKVNNEQQVYEIWKRELGYEPSPQSVQPS